MESKDDRKDNYSLYSLTVLSKDQKHEILYDEVEKTNKDKVILMDSKLSMLNDLEENANLFDLEGEHNEIKIIATSEGKSNKLIDYLLVEYEVRTIIEKIFNFFYENKSFEKIQKGEVTELI